MSNLEELAENQRVAVVKVREAVLAFETAVQALTETNAAMAVALNDARASASPSASWPMAEISSLPALFMQRLGRTLAALHRETRSADRLKLAAGSSRPEAGRNQTVGMRRA